MDGDEGNQYAARILRWSGRMWTRRQQQQFMLGVIFAVVVFLVGLAAQLGGWHTQIGAWVVVSVAGIATLLMLYWAYKWQQSWGRWEPLSLASVSGGRSVDPASRLYEWEAQVPIQNEDDERTVMTKRIFLAIRRGKRVMHLRPKESEESTLQPREFKTIELHFESAGGLDPTVGERETEEYEYATIVVIDTNGNRSERPLGASGLYSTNV